MARPTNKEHIEKLATEVRKHVVKVFGKKERFGKNLDTCCAVASFILWGVLNRFKYKTRLIKGKFHNDDHCWVVVNDQLIVDITASQFNDKKQKHSDVEIQPIDNKDYTAQLIEHAVLQDFASWPEEQRPATYRKEIKELVKKVVDNNSDKAKVIEQL